MYCKTKTPCRVVELTGAKGARSRTPQTALLNFSHDTRKPRRTLLLTPDRVAPCMRSNTEQRCCSILHIGLSLDLDFYDQPLEVRARTQTPLKTPIITRSL
jgi:hypothetical protein